jgi:capsular polysaccharide biosynthesis protein
MDTVNAGSVKTVDSPWTTGLPVAPGVSKWTAVAGLLGLLFMIMIVVVRDMMNDTFKTEDDIRQILDLPILGIIPLEDESADLGKEGGH